GGFLGDGDVVRVAFDDAGRGDADKPSIVPQGLNCGCSTVAHARPDAADELIGHFGEASAVRNPSLDALRHQLVALGFVTLTISVSTPLNHCPEATHAAVFLESAALP